MFPTKLYKMFEDSQVRRGSEAHEPADLEPGQNLRDKDEIPKDLWKPLQGCQQGNEVQG